MTLPTLRVARHRAGLTQRELAERAGHTRVIVGKLERGQGCRPGTVRRLSEALGVRIGDLMGGRQDARDGADPESAAANEVKEGK